MEKEISYHDFIIYDLMARLPEISSRPMMSGWCIYSKRIPFAAIISNQLDLKAMGARADTLACLGWKKSSYNKTGKTVHMNYWQVPDELFDDQESFIEMAEDSLAELRFCAKN